MPPETDDVTRLKRILNNIGELTELNAAGWHAFHDERHYVYGMFRVIGLMAIRMSPALKAAHPEIDWKYVCEYRERFSPMGLDVAIMQGEIEEYFPKLEPLVRAVLESCE